MSKEVHDYLKDVKLQSISSFVAPTLTLEKSGSDMVYDWKLDVVKRRDVHLRREDSSLSSSSDFSSSSLSGSKKLGLSNIIFVGPPGESLAKRRKARTHTLM